jgi:hypothetical protein
MTTNRKEASSVNKTRIAVGAVSLAALLTLTACGGDDSDGSNDTASDPASAPTGRPGGFDAEQLEEIQACLEAAGLEDKLPTGQPSEIPTDLPSDFPTDLGSGAPGGGGFSGLQDPEVQEALDACGIDLPQAPDQG